MTRVYRILRRPFSKHPFDGEGAYRFGGRWSGVGTRLAYTSEHLSLAMLEYFVHTEPGDLPTGLVSVAADIPDRVSRIAMTAKQLPADWRASPAPPALGRFGDEFVCRRRAAVLILPSAISPTECNWLINPLHPDFPKIRVHAAEPFRYDVRIIKR